MPDRSGRQSELVLGTRELCRHICQELLAEGPLKLSVLAKKFGVPRERVAAALKILEKQNLIRYLGRGKGWEINLEDFRRLAKEKKEKEEKT